MQGKSPQLLTRTFLIFLVRAITALAVGGIIGIALLCGYWMTDPMTRNAGIGALVVFPLTLMVGLPVVIAVGFAPMSLLAIGLQAVFRLTRLENQAARVAVGALLGGIAGYAVGPAWGDAIVGAIFGAAILACWVWFGPFSQRFVRHSDPKTRTL